MSCLRVATRWERLLIPAFVYFFAELYPFSWVNDQARKTAAAAGGCVLVRREALERAGGMAAIRGAVIDDVALAKALKKSGSAIWLGLADEVRSVRPYPELKDLWDMVCPSQRVYPAELLARVVAGDDCRSRAHISRANCSPLSPVLSSAPRLSPPLEQRHCSRWAFLTFPQSVITDWAPGRSQDYRSPLVCTVR